MSADTHSVNPEWQSDLSLDNVNTSHYDLCTMPHTVIPTLSPAAVASHCSNKSCYVLVGRNVYDVTEFLQDHPGGEDLIIEYGGKDVEAIMRDELSHSHSESAYEVLNDKQIGYLAGEPIGALRAPREISRERQFSARTGPSITQILKEEDVSLDKEDDVSLDEEEEVSEDYKTHIFLDLNKPLLMQIWRRNFSPRFYVEQVHRPRYYTRGDSAPIFGNFLEPLTVASWWIVPIIWLPPVIYSFHYANERLTPTKTLAFCVIGLALWTLFEYGWHRWICHLE